MRKFIAVPFLFSFALHLQAQSFVNGQAARAVIGQYTFTFGGAIPGVFPTRPGQQILGGLSGLAWNNGTLYVADSNRLNALPQDHRVLFFNTNLIPGRSADLTGATSYSSYNCNLCGFPAFNQLGQPSYDPPALASGVDATTAKATTFNAGVNNTASTSNMQEPTAVATDGTILAVADTNNNRVLIWKTIPTTLNQPADLVLGQSSFTNGTTPATPTASSLSGPQGVWIENGKFFVADSQNYRVLIWNSIPTSNNQPADVVLGQSNFTTGTQSACNAIGTVSSPLKAAANLLCNPVSVTSDGVHVFVSDLGFNRVLIWNSIPTANGQNADVVVGQPDMTSAIANNSALCASAAGAQGQCAASLDYPRFALSDGQRLFIADGGNDRVLIFNSIPTTNGASATGVLGEPDFLTDLAVAQSTSIINNTVDNTSAVDLTPTPTSLALDQSSSTLYVSDPINNRVLAFTAGDVALADRSVVNWASEIIRQEGIVTIGAGTGGLTITANDTATVTIQGTAYAYTVQSTDTADSIAQGLVSKINANSGDPNVIAIFAGTGTASLYLTSKASDLGFKAVTLAATVSNAANLSAVASGNGYLSAGTAATGAPGMLVKITGTNLSDVPDSSPTTAALSGTIATSLGGAQVFTDGIPSPIYVASASQVVAQIPYNFSDRTSTSIYVRTTHNDGSVTVTNATPVSIAGANPGLFDTPNATQTRPYPAAGPLHQPGNPQAVIDVEGSANAGDTATITINGVGHTYTVVSGDTLSTITAGLVSKINSDADPLATAVAGTQFNRVIVVARAGGPGGSGIAIATSVGTSSKVTLTAYNSSTCCGVVPNSPITADNPAVPNEMITVFGAGLGQVAYVPVQVTINLTAGQPYNLSEFNSVLNTNTVSATIGANNTAQVVTANLSPGSYGVYKIQLIVPSGQATDANTQLSIAQGALVSNIVTLPVGAANSTPAPNISLVVDNPNSSAVLSGSVFISGWAAGTSSPIASVKIAIDQNTIGTANYGLNRSDVCNAYTGLLNCPNIGFSYTLDTRLLIDGTHSLQVIATDTSGVSSVSTQTITTTSTPSVLLTIDSPGTDGQNASGLFSISGWSASMQTIISTVQASLDGGPPVNVTYGLSRPDVCAGNSALQGCPNLGFSYTLNADTLAAGSHTVQIIASDANGNAAGLSRTFQVASPISMQIDTPGTDITVSGAYTVSGWATDSVTSIRSVTVAVDANVVGQATYGISRPDVCRGIPDPLACPNVGFSFVLNSAAFLDGKHLLKVTATDANGSVSAMSRSFQTTNASPITIFLESPTSSVPMGGIINIGGWAADTAATITGVQISIDGRPFGSATYGLSRPDVCAAVAGLQGCPNLGFSQPIDSGALADGVHSLQITATDSSGKRLVQNSTFQSSNYSVPTTTLLYLDSPNSSASPIQGLWNFSGWSLSTTSTITSVTISIDGLPYGAAVYGKARPDVCAEYPAAPGCPNVGWNLLIDTTLLSNGTHTLSVEAIAGDGRRMFASNPFIVANWSASNPTIITIENPNNASAAFGGTASFGGWAINPLSAIGQIKVSVDGIPQGGASYGVSRPDVCAAYPNIQGCPNVGWSVSVDTTLLGDGEHTLEVTAFPSSGSGYTATQKFVVNNLYVGASPSLITIDSPNARTGSLSGLASLSGWAVNDNDTVATVSISVDGVPNGYAQYGSGRPDVCASQGRPGCPNVGWTYALNTLTLTAGTHSLQVTSTTAGGVRATASAVFTVLNTAPRGPTSAAISQPNTQSGPYQGVALFAGSALSTSSSLANVAVTIDGYPYGSATPSTAAAGTTLSWTYLLDTTQLTDGQHTFGVTATAADGTYYITSANFKVANWATSDPTQIFVDNPSATSQAVFGTATFSGWTLNAYSTIASVTIAIDGVPAGSAVYGRVRPDVCAAIPSPGCPNVGWTFQTDTTRLANGSHTLAVTAKTTGGQSSTVTTSFRVAN